MENHEIYIKALDLEKTGTQKRQFAEMGKNTCKARCRTDLEDTMILGGRFDHGHVEEEDRTVERQALRQTCKQKAVAEFVKDQTN